NAITFERDGTRVERLDVSGPNRGRLERNLLLFFTGTSRHSSEILRLQQRRTAHAVPDVIESLDAIKGLARDMRLAIESGEIDAVDELLHQGWERKKTLASSITNDFIDECYALARSRGALGGKTTGAGGGGLLLFYCPGRHHSAVTWALVGRGLIPVDFRFDSRGVQVLLNAMKVDAASLRSSGHNTFRLAR